MGILNNVAVQWLIRRVPEVAGIVVFLTSIIQAIPPEHMATIMAILAEQGGGLTVSAYIGLGYYLWTQWQSYRATVKPQIVTTDGKKAELPKGSPVASQAEAVASAAPRPRTLWEHWFGK